MMKGVMKEIGMSSDEPDNWKDILAPKTILSKFQILKHKYAEERYTYALKFQYLYKKLGQDTVIPPR
jgi:hypothetical protein